MHAPVAVSIGKRSAPAVGITQAAYPVPEALKASLLRHLLRHTEMPSVLVFTRTKVSARKLARTIAGDGFRVTELHANLTQPQRNRAMDGFRRGEFQVLVATNVAARGLDVDHITHVISFDVPSVPDDYIHRIGRTARRQNEGDAFVLIDNLAAGLWELRADVRARCDRRTHEGRSALRDWLLGDAIEEYGLRGLVSDPMMTPGPSLARRAPEQAVRAEMVEGVGNQRVQGLVRMGA